MTKTSSGAKSRGPKFKTAALTNRAIEENEAVTMPMIRLLVLIPQKQGFWTCDKKMSVTDHVILLDSGVTIYVLRCANCVGMQFGRLFGLRFRAPVVPTITRVEINQVEGHIASFLLSFKR